MPWSKLIAMEVCRVKRLLTGVVALLVVGFAVAAGWWAARATLSSSAPVEVASAEPVWGEAAEATVGRSLGYATTLRQPAVVAASNALAGVVTSVHPGEVNVGDVLYTVGNTPVRAVQSERPMWRDLARRQSGEDVAALQQMLAGLGHFSGEANGTFGRDTQRAVIAWQKAEGRSQTGTVARGELVALPRFPITVSLGEDIALGKVLAGGEDAVLAPTGAREFVLVLTDDQARLVPAEATIEVTFEDKVWPAVIAGSTPDQGGTVSFELVAPDGGEVCGGDCGSLPLDPQVTLRSQVVVVPRVSGVGVPAAAVRSTPDGATFVITESGQSPVTVLGSGQGMVIVEGIEVGTKIQISDGSAAPAAGEPSAEPTEEG